MYKHLACCLGLSLLVACGEKAHQPELPVEAFSDDVTGFLYMSPHGVNQEGLETLQRWEALVMTVSPESAKEEVEDMSLIELATRMQDVGVEHLGLVILAGDDSEQGTVGDTAGDSVGASGSWIVIEEGKDVKQVFIDLHTLSHEMALLRSSMTEQEQAEQVQQYQEELARIESADFSSAMLREGIYDMALVESMIETSDETPDETLVSDAAGDDLSGDDDSDAVSPTAMQWTGTAVNAERFVAMRQSGALIQYTHFINENQRESMVDGLGFLTGQADGSPFLGNGVEGFKALENLEMMTAYMSMYDGLSYGIELRFLDEESAETFAVSLSSLLTMGSGFVTLMAQEQGIELTSEDVTLLSDMLAFEQDGRVAKLSVSPEQVDWLYELLERNQQALAEMTAD